MPHDFGPYGRITAAIATIFRLWKRAKKAEGESCLPVADA